MAPKAAFISVEQKRNRLTISRDCLERFEADPRTFLDRFVTIDETRVFDYTLESKLQSKLWKQAGLFASKKAKKVLSLNKIMASVFCNSKSEILADYLEKGKTVISSFYFTLLHRLHAEMYKIHFTFLIIYIILLKLRFSVLWKYFYLSVGSTYI